MKARGGPIDENRSTDRTRARATTALALVVVTIGVFLYAFTWVTTPLQGDFTFLDMLNNLIPPGPEMADQDLYHYTVVAMNEGTGYYEAFSETLELRNQNGGPEVNLSTPLSFRPPTLYWLLSLLPLTGISYFLATFAIGIVGAAGGFLLARRLAHPAVAVASYGAVLLLYAGFSQGVVLFGTEIWAGALGLLSVGLLLTASGPDAARDGAGRSWLGAPTLVWAAAAAALGATLLRELAIAFLLVGLLAALADRHARAARWWLPWVAALVLAGIAYAAHVAAATPWLVPDSAGTRGFVWFDATGAGLPAGLGRTAWFLQTSPLVVAVLIAAGVLGALIAPRAARHRVALGLVAIGGPLVATFFHPPGFGSVSSVPGYWIDLVTPTIMACVPLAALVWPRLRATHGAIVADEPRADSGDAVDSATTTPATP